MTRRWGYTRLLVEVHPSPGYAGYSPDIPTPRSRLRGDPGFAGERRRPLAPPPPATPGTPPSSRGRDAPPRVPSPDSPVLVLQVGAARSNSRRHSCPQRVQESRPAVAIVTPLREEAHPIGEPGIPLCQCINHLVVRRLHCEGVQDLVGDHISHLGPADR